MEVVLVGYSGCSYVVYDCLISQGHDVTMYCDLKEKSEYKLNLHYLGPETGDLALEKIIEPNYFVSIGDDTLRMNVFSILEGKVDYNPINSIHRVASVSGSVKLSAGVLIAPGYVINSYAMIGKGVICNTSSVVDHEVVIDDFSYVAPGVVLCGGEKVGKRTFIGVNSVVKQGVASGSDVIIGAGAVVLNDVDDNEVVVGNPVKKVVK